MAQASMNGGVFRKKFIQRLEKDMAKYEILYIYAPFGWGKVSLLKSFYEMLPPKEACWLENAPESEMQEQIRRFSKPKKRTFFIPDLERIVEDGREDLIWDLMGKKREEDVFLIASTALLPSKMLPYTISYRYICYGIEDIRPDTTDVAEYMKCRGVNLTERELFHIEKDTNHMPLQIKLLANLMINAPKGYDHAVREQCREDLLSYIDVIFFRRFTEEDQNAMLRLSYLDQFDNQLIAYMMDLSRKEADALVERLLIKGSVLERDGNGWKFNPVMQHFLKRACQKYLDGEERKNDYFKAMKCLEKNRKWVQAMRFSYLLHDREETAFCLDCLLKEHIDYSVLVKLEDYFRDLPSEILIKYPNLIIAGAILKSMVGDLAAVRKYEKIYMQLINTMADATDKRKMQINLLAAYMSNPGMTREDVMEICTGLLDDLGEEGTEENIRVQPRYISILRGEKDYCKYFDPEYSGENTMEKLHKAAEKLTDHTYAMMLDYAETEVLYDRNELDRALDGLVKITREAKIMGNESMQQLCALGMFDLLAAKNQLNSTDALQIENLDLDVREMSLFDMNCQAHLIYYHLLKNQEGPIVHWMKNAAPDENQFFYTTQYYQYLIKAKVYIWMKQYVRARMILQFLLDYAMEYRMYYLEAQVRILQASVYHRENNPDWKKTLLPALQWGKRMGFIRIFADEGAAVYHLLIQIAQEDKEWERDEYLRKTCAAAKAQMLQYPKYLNQEKTGKIENFSESELAVMRLLVFGHKNSEIASQLCVSENTVKYHLKNIYQKLQVASRSQAIHRIRECNIL